MRETVMSCSSICCSYLGSTRTFSLETRVLESSHSLPPSLPPSVSLICLPAPCAPLLTTHEYTQHTKQDRWLVRAEGVLGPAHVSYKNTAQFEISQASAQKGEESDV